MMTARAAQPKSRRRVGSIAAFVVTTSVLFVAGSDPAAASVEVVQNFGFTACGQWKQVAAPTETLSARFELWGGGGAAGDKHDPWIGSDTNGGHGGAGAYISSPITVGAGSAVWAKIGCGGTDGNAIADGFNPGGAAATANAGGGGGSSALCIAPAATPNTCQSGGGQLVAIAAGGGGGGGPGARGPGAAGIRGGLRRRGRRRSGVGHRRNAGRLDHDRKR